MKISAKKSHVDYRKFFSWLYNDKITNHTILSYVNDEKTKIEFPKNLLLLIIGKLNHEKKEIVIMIWTKIKKNFSFFCKYL